MRFLVTGGAGFLGRHLAHCLAAQGDAVTVLDDLSCPNSNFELPLLRHPSIQYVRGSTLDRPLVQRLVQENTAILHLASVVGVEETIRRPFETMRNLEGTMNVVEALRPEQIVLFTSSADVYGLHSRLHERPMREDDLQLFEGSGVNRWVYPKIKSLEENAVLNGRGRGIVVRVFNCFGPEMDFPHGKRVVPQFVERIFARQPLRISGSGEQRRALCYYSDTVRGILMALRHLLENEAATPTTVNIGSSETWTVLELAQTLQDLALESGILAAPLPIELHAKIYSQDFDDTWHRTPDLQRAKSLLRYAPHVPVREGLRLTLEACARARPVRASRRAAAVVERSRATADAEHETDILILGGGISGLSCRAWLAERSTLLLEAEDEIGGLLRVYPRGEFVFDTSVHAMSFQNAQVQGFIEGFLPAGVHEFEKENLIWQSGHVIDYPYQFNLRQLPPALRQECLDALPNDVEHELPPQCSFGTWLLCQFGAGLYRHFFEPYNTKLYGVHPSELDAAPMVWTIPANNRAAIVDGAAPGSAASAPKLHCLYPRGRRGIAAVIDMMANLSKKPILCGHRVVAIDTKHRIVETNHGLRVRYRDLVSSLPLPSLIAACSDMSAAVRARAATLEAAAVTVVEVGVRARGTALAAHWTYFPDPGIPFYRMTRLERISPDLCPPGSSALLLECPGRTAPDRGHVLSTLVDLGVIASTDVEWYGTRVIPHAYVLFRSGWKRAVDALMAELQEREIRTIGRYGAWRYSNIEQCFLSGVEAANSISAPDGRARALLQQIHAAARA